MPGDAGVEDIGGQEIVTLEKPEAGGGHDEMEKPGLAADRAITLDRFDFGRRHNLEANSPAVAAAKVANQWFLR